MKPLILNPMSRNGTSLVYQLLYGHPEILFVPQRCKIGCSDPGGYPFFGFNQCSLSEFVHILTEKTTIPVDIDKNTAWNNIDIKNMSDVIEAEEIEGLFIRNHKYDRKMVVTEDIVGRLFTEFMLFVSSLFGVNSSDDAKYFLFHDDHIYVFGVASFIRHFGDAHFLQVIRDPFDVVASRKNMLVFHSGERKSASEFFLRKEVVVSETIRAVWNYVAAYLNFLDAKNRYHILKFEALRSDERSSAMAYLCDQLLIEWDDLLLTDDVGFDMVGHGNELLCAGSTASFLTNGKSDKRVGSHKESLTGKEMEWVRSIITEDELIQVRNASHLDIGRALQEFYNLIRSKNIPQINTWLAMYSNGEFEKLWASYSKLNFGAATVNAFV
jgi:hypothetical protein